ncbi:MAG: FAD-dependent oxidoreductase, partial [Rhodospirillales bacterium]|nr:FAD-dependent oxidoreductase [Rhodospirillales bacterium]
MAEYDYDLITLGAGSGGVRASRLAAQTGAKVAVVEVSRVGGTCVLRGCVPKKLLVIGAHYAEDFADAQGYGWDMGEARFDWPTLIHHKNQELDRLNGIYVRLLRDAGVELIEGRGILADPHTVEVDGKRLTARLILVATGGWPSLPQVPGIEHAITSNEALDLERQPKRLVIVGGGYIAVEFAGLFNALGSKVTQIIRGDTVLRGFDQDIRTTLGAEMTKKGVDLRAQSVVRSIEPCEGGFSVRLEGIETVEADCVFYATGRAPNSKGLGLEEAGITLDSKGAVMVDEYSRTAVPHIYAVGDVTNRMNLTPVATAEARCFVETALRNNPLAMDYDNIPS